MSIPPDFLEKLSNRVSVSDVVRRYVRLRKQGREWVGLSPFNKEKTPSFFVNDEKRFYHCFSSGKHGNVFSFLTDSVGMTFREAVEAVAAMTGMEVPSDSPEAAARQQAARSVHETLLLAASYYENQLRLPAGREALDYLHRRGLDEATIRRFRLGYAPQPRGSIAAGIARDGVGRELLVEAGLLKRRDDGSFSDYFRNRVMFPITDRQGHIIAFGARALGDGQPKYLNSPETAVFHKAGVLYGLAQAREASHKAGRVLVVEGYMDVIALAQAGIAEGVASLGTTLGEEQLRLLWTLAAEPALCLDGDRAGVEAAIRIAERALPLLAPGKSLRFAMMPTGEDPDTLVRKAGTDAVNDLIDSAASLEDTIWQAEWQKCNPTSPERRAAFHRAILGQVRRIGNDTVRAYYKQSVRERLRQTFLPARAIGARPELAMSQLGRGSQQSSRRSMPAVRRRADPGRLPQQRQRVLLELLARHPALVEEEVDRIAAIPLSDSALNALRNRILNTHLDAGGLETQVRERNSGDGNAQAVDTLSATGRTAWAAVNGQHSKGLVQGDAETTDEARTKVQELLDNLERDSVQAELLRQADSLTQNPDLLKRLSASVLAERSRGSVGS